MKKLTFTCFSILLLIYFNPVRAQYCGTSGISVCTPDTSSTSGFQSMDSVPCIVQNVAYNQPIRFKMFTTFYHSVAGLVTVDSVEFVSIDNLPCGLCWAADRTTKRYPAGANGCLNISGISSDVAGQYKLSITLKAWVSGSLYPVTAGQVDAAGIKLFLRVQAPSTACAAVDTSSGANNLTASCVTGIRSLADNNISSLSIAPNPINKDGVLIFTVDRNASCVVSISDMTGKVISNRKTDAKPGVNVVTVERGNMPVGIYFISVSDGQMLSTIRFTITD